MHSPEAVRLVCEVVVRAEELLRAERLSYERRMLNHLLGTHDRREGKTACLAKRAPELQQ